MTTVDVVDLIRQLTDREAALGDPLDIPRSTRAYETYWKTRQAIGNVRSGLMNLPQDLIRAQTRLDAVEADRTAVIEKQRELQQAILDAPDWQTIRDGRERDKEYNRQQTLRRQLAMLNDGTLLSSPTTTYPPLSYLDKRIEELTDRRNRVQSALDGHIAEAERLLAEQTVSS